MTPSGLAAGEGSRVDEWGLCLCVSVWGAWGALPHFGVASRFTLLGSPRWLSARGNLTSLLLHLSSPVGALIWGEDTWEDSREVRQQSWSGDSPKRQGGPAQLTEACPWPGLQCAPTPVVGSSSGGSGSPGLEGRCVRQSLRRT